MIRIILTIVFVILCIAMTVIVLMQEGKTSGLGAISGVAESYWGKNKAVLWKGNLEKFYKNCGNPDFCTCPGIKFKGNLILR